MLIILFSGDSDFEHFCELCGRAKAQKLFRKYLSELRVYNHQHRVQRQLDRLPRIFSILVPDVAMLSGKSWDTVINYLQTLPDFHNYFQVVSAAGNGDYGRHSPPSSPSSSAAAASAAVTDVQPDGSESGGEDDRVSCALLHTREAEAYYRNHVAFVEAQNRRQKLLRDFSQLLSTCSQVTPGKPLNDVRIFLLGKECFESLPENDIQTIYDQYQ
ncbi:unnamed protein product, partial [Soboliphyme baturini]|uniref:RhoGAP-FF1 domain-containing protein n=1 Tax=Soboliphyme baturini TaxID=241478 RepID=A0A183JAI0_9BILA